MGDRSILITGFSPMDGWQQNASELLVASLQRELPQPLRDSGANISFAIVPAKLATLTQCWNTLSAQYQADIYIFLGQARGRPLVCLERFALNIIDFVHPDADGEKRSGAVIDEAGPQAYTTNVATLPQLLDRLKTSGIPAAISNHAGASLCNYLYYTALHSIAQSAGTQRALFVHVPVLPEQAIAQWPEAPTVPLSMLREAVVELVLGVTAG